MLSLVEQTFSLLYNTWPLVPQDDVASLYRFWEQSFETKLQTKTMEGCSDVRFTIQKRMFRCSQYNLIAV